MLCARQVAAYLEREDNHTNQKSHLPDFLRIYEFLLFHFGMKCIRQILPENIFNYLEEGLNFTKVLILPFAKRDFHFHIDAAVFDMHF